MCRHAHHVNAPVTETSGPWPFITRRKYNHRGRLILWRARQNRKGLLPAERGQESATPPFWQTQTYNWITGLIFSIGAALFMLGAMLSLMPEHWTTKPSAPIIGVVFFLGSIPFTTAAYAQHFQAANSTEFELNATVGETHQRISFIGWQPKSPGWLSTFTQFVGTVAFNFNTFDAIHPALNWYEQDMTIWTPGMIGSTLFLISGYLAFIEACHSYWAWKPKDLGWRIGFINLLGCIFFMIAGVISFVPKGPEPGWIVNATNGFLWLGALGFFTGALLLMQESAQVAPRSQDASGQG